LAYLHNTKEQNIDMESKLNFKAIEAYARDYSTRLADDLYSQKEVLSGSDILKLSVEQVGLFIINNIYKSWAVEAENLESPYFNYRSENVKSAMQKLMNVLSNNIAINKSDFDQLLFGAVKDTIILFISPYQYYSSLLKDEENNIDLLISLRKFQKVNVTVLDKVIEKLEVVPDLIKEPNNLLGEVFNELEDEPENYDEAFVQFAALVPFEETSFFLAVEANTQIVQLNDTDEDGEDDDGTLNEIYKEGNYETVADQLKGNQSIDSLKSMLSINQKFMFINDLFSGNQEDFTKVLEFLESCETKEEAHLFVQNNYLKHNIWKENAPQVKEFMKLLDKRFSA